MNQFEMVVLIVGIVMLATVLKARYRRHGGEIEPRDDDGEAVRLREEVKKLQERIHVLERITTDRENSLSREIEELRDR